MFKLIIFDLDGVITDTAKFHYLAWKKLTNKIGIDIDIEFNEQLKGVGRLDSLERILANYNISNNYTEEEKIKLSNEKNNYYVSLIDNMTSDDILSGIIELINWLKEKGFKIALGSASRNAPRIINHLGIAEYLDYIVDPDSVKLGKPAPDLFLKAASHFNTKPEECIVIEDAFSGVQAAKAANMYAVGVGNKDVLFNADKVVETTDLLLNLFMELIR